MPNINDYILFIHDITELYSYEKRLKESVSEKHKKDFPAFDDELESLYSETINSLYKKYLTPFLERYSFLTSPSYLQVVLHRERKEADHSLFLKYILGNQCNVGKFVLMDLCNIIGCKSEWIKSIGQNPYTVECEFSTKWQRKHSMSLRRMDLLIKDEKSKWLIVIENKIDSKIRIEKGNQLDAYSEFCKRKYFQYDKLYILLSYREDNFKDIENHGWQPLNYYSVFNVLLKYAQENDFIKEYLKILYFLLFPNFQFSYVHNHASLYRCSLFISRVILKLNQNARNFIA